LRYVHANEDKNKQKIKQTKAMKERKKKNIEIQLNKLSKRKQN
jgi:hypothetical protein